MKISKLFHWLYAFLMFLPVLALAPSLFYFAFNQQSQNYTDVQVNETYEYETNEVNSVDDLVVGNIYHLSLDQESYIYSFTLNFDISYNFDCELDTTFISTYFETGTPRFIKSSTRIYYIPNQFINNNVVINYGVRSQDITTWDIDHINFDFVFISLDNDNIVQYISASDYLGEKTVDVERSEQSPLNIFYTAVNYVYDMPVFSWAKNSFLALPITYVTGLFGMASTNVVNYYLSYWLAISIVYLVFDLVMYVPMLVHRWIDKGMIE